VNRGGGSLRRLTFDERLNRLPAWTPDSQSIIYSQEVEDSIFDLRQVDIDDPNTDTLIYSNGGYNGHARYSPDGRYIVFTTGTTRIDAGSWEIARLDTRTGEILMLTDNDVRDGSPVWSPDGTQILYITFSLETNSNDIAVMNADGSNQRVLFNSEGQDWAASYSPDGQYIVFTTDLSGQDQINLMTADGSAVQQITTSGGNYASWIPASEGN
ncbi:MAG: hypothetical protein AAFQ07_16760, partial [Chloroflexota bacterium]